MDEEEEELPKRQRQKTRRRKKEKGPEAVVTLVKEWVAVERVATTLAYDGMTH